MLGFNGGLIGVRRTPSTAGAAGLWLPSEQSLAQGADAWPKLFPSPSSVVYSQSSVYPGTTPISNALMTDGIATNTGAATSSGDGQFFMLDLGAPFAVGSTIIGTGTPSIPGGWSRAYTEERFISYSIDGTNWFNAFYTDTFSADGIYTLPTVFTGRFVRVVDPANSWIALTEFGCNPATAAEAAVLTEDPYFGSVTLLLHLDGADGSLTFTDSSVYGRSVSRTGNTRISTDRGVFSDSSAFFDGSGGLLTMPSAPQLVIPASMDFTVEAQVYSRSTADQIIGGSATQNVQVFRLNESGPGTLSFYLNGLYVFSPTAAGIITNAWMHLAISRVANTTRMFVNGVQIGAANTSWIGSFDLSRWGSMFGNHFNGYLDEVRVTRGIGRYTENFTPPAAKFPGL